MEPQQSEVINKTERANSFRGRYAGVGSEFAIYFDTALQLKEGIDMVVAGKVYFEQKLAEKKAEDMEKM